MPNPMMIERLVHERIADAQRRAAPRLALAPWEAPAPDRPERADLIARLRAHATSASAVPEAAR